MKSKFWHALTTGILSLATITLAIYAYMVLVPLTPILEIKSSTVLTKEVQPGGNIEVLVDTCKNHRYTATITRRLTNSIIVQLPDVQGNQPTGCKKETFTIHIPEELSPGTYYFSAQFTYNINQFNTKTYDMRTNTFTVVE